jgi:hypothetical protein
MRRFVIALGIAVGAIGAASPVTAERPTIAPPVPAVTAFMLPGGEICDFDIEFAVVRGKAGGIYFQDGRDIITAPGMQVRLSSASASIDLGAAGAFHDAAAELIMVGDEPTGVTWTTKMVGQNVLFGLFDDGDGPQPGLRYVVGKATARITIDFTGAVTWPVFSEIDASAARVVDLCAALD